MTVHDLIDLNDRQWQAVRETERHVLVSAGAGTGKTRAVVGRVLYLLGVELRGERRAAPLSLRDVAAITFTNAAAADLKEKLREALRAAGRPDDAYVVDVARFGTIHAFCGEILRAFALRAGSRPATDVLEESEGAAFAAEAVHDAVLRAAETGTTAGLTELLGAFSVADVERWVTELIEDSDRLRGYGERLEPRERTLVDLAGAALGLLEERLRARGAVDFDRMIVWTRDLLRDHADVRRVLQRRIKTLIVDEFQDVDPVQREIAYLLGEPATGRADTTRLMLVGDAKQSIFRFRRADVSVWREVERDFADHGHGLVVPLDENFRSVPAVLGFVDAAMGPILDQPSDGTALRDYEVPYQPLVAHRHDETGPVVELIVVPPQSDGKDHRAEQVRVIEAAAVARRARELHDREGVAWSDMAVLLTGWGGLATYQDALERAGAPTYALRTDKFYTRREVIDMIVALETLRDPGDNRALLGFLRSPFAGLRDDTLLAIARQTRRPYWDHRRELVVHEQSLLERALGALERHVAVRDRLPTAELLESLLHETGYLAHLALLGEAGRQAIANVRKFVGLTRGLADLGVGAFLRVVNEARARQAREPDAVLHGQGDGVVTITSVHSAKGLEWKVVFWCDLVRQVPAVEDDLLRGRDRIALKDPDLDTQEQPARWQEVRLAIQAEEDAEDKRVWYVAMTRARDRLVLAGLPAGQREHPRLNTPAGWLWRALPGVPMADGAFRYAGRDGRTFAGTVRVADAAVLAAAAPAAPVAVADPLTTLAGPVTPLVVAAGRPRHSATELLTYARCATKHWFKYVAGLREPAVDRAAPRFMDAVTRGTIVHDVLERLEEEAELDALLEDAITRLDPEAPAPDGAPGQAYREHLRDEIERVATHTEYRAVADLPTARRELGFIHLGKEGEYAQGKFDLAAVEAEGLVLLDVKTSQGDAAAAARKAGQYAPQRDVYVTAAEGIAPGTMPVARFAFQFSRAAVQLSEGVTTELRTRARAELTRIAQEIGRGKPELTRFPEECRHCGYKAVGWCEGVDGPARGPAPRAGGTRAVQGDLFGTDGG